MEETMTATTVESAARSSPIKPAERRAAGKRRRDTVARNEHAGWRAHPDRADHPHPSGHRCDPAAPPGLFVVTLGVRRSG